MTDKIRIGSILNESLVNGEGIRTVVFFSGCNKFCKGCQNEGLQDFKAGYDISIDDLVDKILENRAMIDGVTLSGGDPLCQYIGCLKLCKKLKKHGINIWLYTGETFDQILLRYNSIVHYVDVIVDGRYEESLKRDGLLYRGSSNQTIIHLEQGDVVKTER